MGMGMQHCLTNAGRSTTTVLPQDRVRAEASDVHQFIMCHHLLRPKGDRRHRANVRVYAAAAKE